MKPIVDKSMVLCTLVVLKVGQIFFVPYENYNRAQYIGTNSA